MIFKLGDKVKFIGDDGECQQGVVTNVQEQDKAVGISSNLKYYRRSIEDVVLDYDAQRKEFLNTNAAEPQHHDAHYKTLGVQPVMVINDWPIQQQIGAYRFAALKYLMRMGTKDSGLQEVEKAHRFTEWLVQVLKGEKVNPNA